MVASYNYVQPVVATAFAMAWGIGSLTLYSGLATCMILVGVWMVSAVAPAKKVNLSTPLRGRLLKIKH